MTTTDCAKCGRKGGKVTINWKNQFVDAQGVTWWEQKNGDSWCGPCEEGRIARLKAAKVLGKAGGSQSKGFSAEEIEKRRVRMRDIANAYHARQRAEKVAKIMAEHEAAKAAPSEGLEGPAEGLVESVAPEGAPLAENAKGEG